MQLGGTHQYISIPLWYCCCLLVQNKEVEHPGAVAKRAMLPLSNCQVQVTKSCGSICDPKKLVKSLRADLFLQAFQETPQNSTNLTPFQVFEKGHTFRTRDFQTSLLMAIHLLDI